MKYEHEIINYGKGDLISVTYETSGYFAPHWHHSMEIMMFMQGNGKITVERQEYELSEGDIIIVNSNEIHETLMADGIKSVFQIPMYSLDQAGIPHNARFQCYPPTEMPDAFRDLQSILSNIWVTGMRGGEGSQLLISSMFYQLMYELVTHFQISSEGTPLHKKEQLDKLDEILDYMNTHFQEEMPLTEVARQAALTPTYFSMLFKKNMGMTFFQYLTSIRLHHATADLTRREDTIETIALDNGFSNSKYFVKAFKEQYQMTPSQYRSVRRAEEETGSGEKQNSERQRLSSYEGLIQIVSKYLRAAPQIPPKI